MPIYSVRTEELLARLAQTKGGSDLIVTVGKPPQFKVHGEVTDVPGYEVLTPPMAEELCLSVLNEEQVRHFRSDKELDLSLQVEGVARFRVNIFLQRGCTAMVCRIVMDKVPGFQQLGLPPVIEELAKLRKGLVLFTGPTGHGKSTSVAAMVDYINQNRRCHIISVEDPIEYVHTHAKAVIEQREVGLDTDSFHGALRRILRQAPDVIVIGEIRDRESAAAAMTLAGNPTDPTEFTYVDQTDGDIVQRYWIFDGAGKHNGEEVPTQSIPEYNPNVHTSSYVYDLPGEYEPSLLILFESQKLQRAFLKDKITVL